jgi:hypothetical protein
MIYRLLLLFSLLVGPVSAQNLVINGSFEDTECLPDQFNAPYPISNNWYSPTTGTPDLFGIGQSEAPCMMMDINSPNFTVFGEWQYPQHGERMAGLYTYFSEFCIREYLQARLSAQLVAGTKYCVSFHVSLSNSSTRAHDRMGIALTADSVTDFQTSCLSQLVPSATSPAGQMLTDTAEWMHVYAEFTALGGERYITIGNLYESADMTLVEAFGFSGNEMAYYFIDNIELYDCGTVVGASELSERAFSLYHDPTSDMLTLRGVQIGASLTVRDMSGREVLKVQVDDRSMAVDISGMNPGIYVAVNGGRVARFVKPY